MALLILLFFLLPLLLMRSKITGPNKKKQKKTKRDVKNNWQESQTETEPLVARNQASPPPTPVAAPSHVATPMLAAHPVYTAQAMAAPPVYAGPVEQVVTMYAAPHAALGQKVVTQPTQIVQMQTQAPVPTQVVPTPTGVCKSTTAHFVQRSVMTTQSPRMA